MKVVIIAYISVLLHLISFSQKGAANHFSIQGRLAGQDTGIIRLSYRDSNSKFIQDTCVLIKGVFNFEGHVNEPTAAVLRGRVATSSVDDPNAAELFLEPADINVIVKVNEFSKAVISGSKTQNDLSRLREEESSILDEQKPLDSIWIIVTSALQKDENNKVLKSRADSVHAAFQPFRERIRKIDYHFIASNPDSYVSPYLLLPYISDLRNDSAKMFFSALTRRVKASRYGQAALREIKRQAVALAGDTAKNFSVKDINGKLLSLASFKNRSSVLLDFWASWCVPCRQGNPHLTELYKMYHPKGLEIISIAMDDNDPVAWKAAIRKDNIAMWHHALQGKNTQKKSAANTEGNNIGELYGIQAIPVKILIDKEGNIMGRYEGGNDAELDKKLANMFLPD